MAKLHSYDEKNVSFYYMDEHAKKGSQFDVSDIELPGLVSYLSEALPNNTIHREVLLARGFVVWLAETHGGSVFDLLVTSLTQEFKNFCQFANIECVEIPGKLKPGSIYDLVDDDQGVKSDKAWNAFKGNGRWHLVNPGWCLILSVVGHDPGGRVSLESDGKTEMEEVGSTSGQLVSFFDEDWFCVDHDVFLMKHIPDDPQWQLRSGAKSGSPVTYETWLNMPYFTTCFFEANLHLMSEQSCRLNTKNGRCSIVLSADKEVFKNLSFHYNISMKASDASGLTPDNLPRIVLPERNERDCLYKFDVGCPVKGGYFIVITYNLGGTDRFLKCCEFMIECEEPDPYCRKAPVDTGILGFGFGPKAEEAGLKRPSEKGSKIVMEATGSDEVKDDEETNKEISFKVDLDAIKDYEFGSCVCEDDEEEQVPLTLDEGRRQLTVNVPLRPQTDYALALNKRPKDSGDQFEKVLYYLVTSRQEDKAESEKLTQQVKEKRKELKLEEKTVRNASLKEQLSLMREAVDALTETEKQKKK